MRRITARHTSQLKQALLDRNGLLEHGQITERKMR